MDNEKGEPQVPDWRDVEMLTPIARLLAFYAEHPSPRDGFVGEMMAEFIGVAHRIARCTAISLETRP